MQATQKHNTYKGRSIKANPMDLPSRKHNIYAGRPMEANPMNLSTQKFDIYAGRHLKLGVLKRLGELGGLKRFGKLGRLNTLGRFSRFVKPLKPKKAFAHIKYVINSSIERLRSRKSWAHAFCPSMCWEEVANTKLTLWQP